MKCYCKQAFPFFEKDMLVICENCGGEIECHAPDASDEGKRSSGIGVPQQIGQSVPDVLIQLLKITENQQSQIEELTKGVEYLAQQIKGLVDALAEEADPDAPLTNYLSGKPI
jgi:hypothetical protein